MMRSFLLTFYFEPNIFSSDWDAKANIGHLGGVPPGTVINTKIAKSMRHVRVMGINALLKYVSERSTRFLESIY